MSTFLPEVLAGGVDVVQLREKVVPHDQQRESARLMQTVCRDFGVPFLINDSPELAATIGADGVHVGQDDDSVLRCRELLGDEALIGLSTHEVSEFSDALLTSANYFSAGPITPTPTKPGRAGTGIEYPAHCQKHSDRPVFVTGGVTEDNVGRFVEAGLRHFVVVRALTESPRPRQSARAIRDALDEAMSTVTI